MIHTTEHLISVLALIAIVVSVAGAIVFFDAITDIQFPTARFAYAFQESVTDAVSIRETVEGANVAVIIEKEAV